MRASWIIVIGLLLFGYSAFAHGDYGGHMGGWPMMGGGMWCFIFWIAVAIVALIVIIFAVRYLTARGIGVKAEKSSLEILKERYAKGEISKAEFDEMKRDLES